MCNTQKVDFVSFDINDKVDLGFTSKNDITLAYHLKFKNDFKAHLGLFQDIKQGKDRGIFVGISKSW